MTSIGGFFAMSRLLTPDMTMTFWITAAITAALHRRHWLFFIFMGVGFLTKGPMALIVPLCAVGWNEGTRDMRTRRIIRNGSSAPALPHWQVALAESGGGR